MKPVEFKEANKVLGPPKSMQENCVPLPVFTDGKMCTSCWELSEEELDRIKKTGRIYLTVVSGRTQPPVAVEAEKPIMQRSDLN